MFNFMMNCFIWVFALYGIVDVTKMIWARFIHKRIDTKGIYVIIAAKNQESQIEMFLRSVIFRILYGKEEQFKSIIVTDLNSKDHTKEILEKFSNDYDEIKMIEWDDLKEGLDKV